MGQKAAELTRQFYEWERRGRGWELADYPVDLEPPFAPFFRSRQREYIDDGKRPTLLSRLADAFRPRKPIELETPEIGQQEPFRSGCDELLERISIFAPKGYASSLGDMEQLLVLLSNCRHPFSFEIVGTASKVEVQLVCSATDAPFAEQQAKAFLPGCTVVKTTEEGENLVNDEVCPTAVTDFGLEEEFVRPLQTRSPHDSYTSLFAVIGSLKGNERAVLQVLCAGTVNQWHDSVVRSVTDPKGGSFFVNAPEMPGLAREKASAQFLACTIRLLTQSDSPERAMQLMEQAGTALVHASKSPSNALMPLLDPRYSFGDRTGDMLRRASHRTGMLLNLKELSNLLHVPNARLSDKLGHMRRRTKAAPEIAMGHDHALGINSHFGMDTEAGLGMEQRLKHVHVIGATGTGKSTLLLNMIVQDMWDGNGCAVLDPHGDLIDSILAHVPAHRESDIVIVDPSDTGCIIPFNLLKAHSAIEKEILASDLVATFRRLSTSWGDQMNSVFANAILAFLESSRGGTLIDLRSFLIEKGYREKFLETVEDEHIRYYWQKEYPLLKTSSIGPILTRLDTFLRPTLIRNMVSQRECIDIASLMDSGKIILVKLSQGLIGAENSYLLGTCIVSKIQQVAMSRQAQKKEDRQDFFLYIDEFQHFITPSMNTILSGARKYHVGLVLAHQGMQQLQKNDSGLAGEVLANAGTRICFRLGEYDAKLFGSSFSSFAAEDLQQLGRGEAIARIERPDCDFTLSTYPLDELPLSQEEIDDIVAYSRRQYGKEILPKGESDNMEGVTDPIVQTSRQEVQDIPKGDGKNPLPVSPAKEGIAELTEDQKQETIQRFVQQKELKRHRALQLQVKKMAEEHGYKATIEQVLPNGGKVDVSLERDGRKIACEVSITTDAEWEWHNVKKCIEAKYMEIWCITVDDKTLQQLIEKTALLSKSIGTTIRVILSEDMQTLFVQTKFETKETVMKGYRVNVQYAEMDKLSIGQKRQSVATILENIVLKK
ncbi:type IV secretory system conjugative DNA transfer family protein [Parasediminibacterium sp. JCM 36343]|uniref:type IV secretory system conjugative DNA transfer family protein n=1 Tax=Parasediminibacterium sp. JCM 36343 TaxID=3374279 RepID=UPI00397D985D